jgi:hypothetical protein
MRGQLIIWIITKNKVYSVDGIYKYWNDFLTITVFLQMLHGNVILLRFTGVTLQFYKI